MFDPTRFSKSGGSGGTLTGGDSEEQKKREAYQRIEQWCLGMIESELLRRSCIISVQEVVCGDPNCAPVDTVIAFTFEEGGQGMLSLPMSPVKVTEETLREVFPPAEILEKWHRGEEADWPPEPEPQELRFELGMDVLCRVGPTDWLPGKIIQLWYREQNWPEWVYAPYKILLDDGRSIFAPQDNDQIIRLNPASTNNAKILSQRQQEEADEDENDIEAE